MEITFKDTKIYYTSHGSGQPLVLLHGFLESHLIWKDFIPDFSKYGQIISIDLPGHGNSGCISNVHSMELMAEAVHDVLEELQIQKSNFIGHSMGGYVTLAFAEKYPEMVQDLMLLNSTPAADSEEKKINRDRSVEVVQKNKKAYISMAISNLLPPENDKKFSEEVQELKDRAYRSATKGITAALKGMKERKDRTNVLKNFKGHKVIVAGKRDPIMDWEKIKALAEQCGCDFFSFSGGHLSYIENKKEFFKLCISSIK